MDLNLRNIPEELIRKLKAEAALSGLTLRGLCLGKLSGPEIHTTGRGLTVDFDRKDLGRGSALESDHRACHTDILGRKLRPLGLYDVSERIIDESEDFRQ